MKIMAFLQNQWFNDPERVKALIERNEARERELGWTPQYRLQFIHYTLFAGCLTGKRLKAAFGNLCNQIIWEEGSKEVGGRAGAFFPPDREHILSRINEENPNIILVFGKANIEIFRKNPAFHITRPEPESFVRPVLKIEMPHPAARIVNIQSLLNEGAEKCRKLMEKYLPV